MSKPRTCIICHERQAEVPDRDRMPGRPIKRVCRKCHGERLMGDLKRVMEDAIKRRQAWENR